MILRPYQHKIIEETRALMRQGVKSILITAPTASGKTVLVAHMLKTAESRGMASFFIVHRRELVKQSTITFSAVGVRHGICAANFQEDKRPLVQIASIQTLARRFNKYRKPSLIIWDEAHHCAANTWKKIHAAFPEAYHIGLTATPARLDGQGLKPYFSRMVNGPSVEWLIENKYLAPYKLYAPVSINLNGLHTSMGDWVKSELSERVDKPTITGDAIKQYLKHAEGKRAVVFAVSIEHSKHIAAQFVAAGIPAAHIDGETDIVMRDYNIDQFREGKIKILSNVDLCGEGFDLPALEAAILLRPTQSLGLYLQQIGRTLRIYPGKPHAIILDHVGACERHGLPDDPREWTLEGRDKKQDNGVGIKVKVCGRCYAAQRPGSKECKFCGLIFEIQSREVEQKDGELSEVDILQLRRRRNMEQGRCRNREELLELARQRKYRNPNGWVYMIMQSRQRKKLAGA